MGASAINLMNIVISRTTYQTTKLFIKKGVAHLPRKNFFAENSLVQAIIIVMGKKPQTILQISNFMFSSTE